MLVDPKLFLRLLRFVEYTIIHLSFNAIMKGLTFLVVSICMVVSYKPKYFQKAKLIGADVKLSMVGNSDLYCSVECSKDASCEGFTFDGTTCSILQNVGIDKFSTDKNAWVNSVLSKYLSSYFTFTIM